MAPLQKRILTMNRGSATLKSALYEISNRETLIASMTIDPDSGSRARLKISDPSGTPLFESRVDQRQSKPALDAMIAWLSEHGFFAGLAAAGHRLVHGGPKYSQPQKINAKFLRDVEKLAPLDPDHLPEALRGIRYVAEKFPNLPQVACFDTAFHSSLPTVARAYALPQKFFEKGIRRYGFHGLSFEYVMGELQVLDPERAAGRVIIAHLGSGASMVAVREGKSVDTSMGFTPIEGLVMATRSGDVDPGVLIYLLQREKISAKNLSTLLNKKSGLLGISATSADMKNLLEKMGQDARASEAVGLFCYRAKKYIGAYAAALGGLDVLVFAGGIGERAPLIRERICDGLEFLGLHIDSASNTANSAVISSPKSRVKIRVIKTDEDLMIARHVRSALGWAKT